MEKTSIIDSVEYDPDRLLDTLIDKLKLKNDAALSRALEVTPPVISKIRHRRLTVGASLLIRMHEISDLSRVDRSPKTVTRQHHALMGGETASTRRDNAGAIG